jgi:phosphatidylglycerol:prolipoprotein diacylglycerol transferase
MIPWIESHTYTLGPLVLQTWGTFIAAAFVVAGIIAARRAKTKGLDPKVIWDLVFWIFIAAFIGARAFHVFFYDFGHYVAYPLDAIDPRQTGYSIMGGFIGAAIAIITLVRKRGLDLVAYADVLAWGLPWGCGIGRIGCFLIHDHPGTLTSLAIGVKYPDGQTRHDLGLELSMLGFAIGIMFVLLDRKAHRAGFFVGLFLVIDGICRFLLDFLRVVDRRVVGLTPTQWVLIASVGLGAWLLCRKPAPQPPLVAA